MLSFLIIAATANVDVGRCPKSNTKKDLTVKHNSTSLGGLWYEYVFTPSSMGDAGYDCATWNLL